MITVHTVGTSAVAPTARRNLSANLINFRGERILFDCGEGTQRTLMQKNLGLMKIDKVFITHWHADHFSGLLGLIQTLSMEDRKRPLEIYGPARTEEFMDMLLNLGYFDRSYEIKVREIEEGDIIEDISKGKEYKIIPFETEHHIPSQGYVFQEESEVKANKEKMKELGLKPSRKIRRLKQGEAVEVDGRTINPEDVTEEVKGRKIVYSGDTEYIDNLAKYAEEADLLIHEATFLHDLIQGGKYGHCSAKQAGMVAKEAGAKKLVLTHISRRYEGEEDRLINEAKQVFENVVIAEDGKKFEIEPYRPEDQ